MSHPTIPEPEHLQREVDTLRRKVKQLERDNRILSAMSTNAEQLRRFHEAERKLQSLYNDLLLENSPNIILLFDQELCLVNCTSTSLPLLGFSHREEARGVPMLTLFSSRLERRWVERVCREHLEVMASQALCQYDSAIPMEDGSTIHAQIAISPILDDGECRGTVMSITNVTQLIEARERAEEAAQSKSSFLANMSHEIRTPMNAVKGFSELLALTDLNDLQQSYLEHIISSSNSLLHIIGDVLDFSKIDANRVELTDAPYQLSELIKSVSNMISMRGESKLLLVLVEADPSLPAVVRGDENRVRQIVTNLLSNAIKYTHQGYVRAHISFETLDEEQITLSFQVEDSGVGIRQEDLPHLFHAFSRMDLHANRNIAGTGLGLAISQRLALAMGGDIAVRSEYRKGSVFTLTIPQTVVDWSPMAQVENPETKHLLLVEPGIRAQSLANMLEQLDVPYTILEDIQDVSQLDSHSYTHLLFHGSLSPQRLEPIREALPGCRFACLRDLHRVTDPASHQDTPLYLPLIVTDLAAFLNEDSPSEGAELPSHREHASLSAPRARVLVVDDNEINLMVAGEMLRVFDIDADYARHGLEALSLCTNQDYDLIFMDHMMPGLDGVETTARIRAGIVSNQDTPIVALTANVVNNVKEEFLQAGMNDFIGKPVELSDLERVLLAWLPPDLFAAETMGILPPLELIGMLDGFGFSASQTLQDMKGDFAGYIKRMEWASDVLESLIHRLQEGAEAQSWGALEQDLSTLSHLLASIGASQYANLALSLSQAARQGDSEPFSRDFRSLMGSVYLLDQKLSVLVPLAQGNLPPSLHPFQQLVASLEQMGKALEAGAIASAQEALAEAAAHSLDSRLDDILKEILFGLEEGRLEQCSQLYRQHIAGYSQSHLAF